MSVPPPEPAALEVSPPCPNCGQPWQENAPACPNCGFLRPSVWPPPGSQPGVSPRPPSNLVTNSVTADILLALGISVVCFATLGAGLLLNPILYFALRRQYPVFARGLGFGWLGGTALTLGALAVCIAALSQSSQNGH